MLLNIFHFVFVFFIIFVHKCEGRHRKLKYEISYFFLFAFLSFAIVLVTEMEYDRSDCVRRWQWCGSYNGHCRTGYFFSSRLSAMHISTAILYILDKYIYIEIYIYSVSYFSIMLLFFIFMCANIIATASPRIAVIRWRSSLYICFYFSLFFFVPFIYGMHWKTR